ncbi:hypothetical protein NIES4075_59890 [Tolypothrix sp. NIES-4075]|nr:hypothetical protein NIES4075_59890 [Tolypothrix sp. NIES-4075]
MSDQELGDRSLGITIWVISGKNTDTSDLQVVV